MSLIAYNGSPRGLKSNSAIILDWFLEGYNDNEVEKRFLFKSKQHKFFAKEIKNFNDILMVFPLYVDGMPGQVKNFMEELIKYKEDLKNKSITYIIHSGFNKGIQNRELERYLIRFSSIMGLNNHGVIVIPGSEGFRVMPPFMINKKHSLVSKLGGQYKIKEAYNKRNTKKLVKVEKASKFKVLEMSILSRLSLSNFYWNSSLKKNDAFNDRFNKPYQDNPIPITTKAAISIKNK